MHFPNGRALALLLLVFPGSLLKPGLRSTHVHWSIHQRLRSSSTFQIASVDVASFLLHDPRNDHGIPGPPTPSVNDGTIHDPLF